MPPDDRFTNPVPDATGQPISCDSAVLGVPCAPVDAGPRATERTKPQQSLAPSGGGQHSRDATPRIAGFTLGHRGKCQMGPGETWGPGGRFGAGTRQSATGGGLTLEQWALASAAHRMAVLA